MDSPWPDESVGKTNGRPRKYINYLVYKAHRYRNRLVIGIAVGLILIIASGLLDDNILSYTQISRESISNPALPSEGLYFFVKLYSPTFAANTPMKTEVFLYLNTTFRAENRVGLYDEAPASYDIVFKGTYCGEPSPAAGQIPLLCVVRAYKQFDLFYYGTGNVTYSHGGQFDVYLDSGAPTGRTSVHKDFIHISPTEATNQFRTFKMSLIIGVIAASIATLSLLRPK